MLVNKQIKKKKKNYVSGQNAIFGKVSMQTL